MTRFRLLPLVAIAALAGCSETAPPPIDKAVETKSTEAFAPVTYAQLDAKIKEQKGKVLVVDVWSMSCTVCIKKFPGLVKLHDELKDQGLAVIALSTDDDEDLPKAKKFIAEKKATFPVYLFKDDEAAEKKWEVTYPLSPQPMVWIYNRDGVRVYDGTGSMTEEAFREKVMGLLAKK